MSYADSLRQQAAWVREALDPATPDTQRITFDDIDVDEIEAAAAHMDRMTAALEVIAGSADKWQAIQAKAALDNIGPPLNYLHRSV